MPRQIKKDSTDIILYVFIVDSSDGEAETGITIADLDLQYVRFGEAPSVKVDAIELVAIDGAHEDNKMKEVDGTNQPGLYRVDWLDAAFATGVNGVILTVKGTGFQPVHTEIELTSYDPYDAVRMGMTALPNADAEAAGGLFTRGEGAGQIKQDTNGQIDVDIQKWLGTTVTTPAVAGVPEVDLTHVMGSILTEGGAGRLAGAIIKLFDVVTPVLVTSDVMRGTDGANTVVPDVAGTAATPAEVATALTNYDSPTKAEMDAVHAATDALIVALNDPTAAVIATAVMAKAVDGAIDVTECLKVLLAVLAGDMAKSGNTYTYDEQAGTVKLTEVVSSSAVERTIAP